MILSTNALADNSVLSNDIIYPKDNKCIKRTDFGMQGEYEFVIIPFRSALEAIGASVVWNEEERNISISHNGEDFIASLDYIDDVFNTIKICKSKYKDYTLTNLSIQLNSSGEDGYYEIIDDSTYVDDCAMIRLFYYWGYYININNDNMTFDIIPVNEDSDKIYKKLYEEKFLILDGIDIEEECITLEAWCCSEFCCDYNAFNVISYSSKRLSTDDLEVQFEFTYNNKELEAELDNENLWEITNNTELLSRFAGIKVYKRIRNEDLRYDYYVVKCNDHYVGYSVVPKWFLM